MAASRGSLGRAPGPGSGEMSRRTKRLRPGIALSEKQIAEARRLRREGREASEIAALVGAELAEVEKALVQMRSPRPETTRGTLNVTLAAHAVVMRERRGDEPLWQTVDRLLAELLRLRAEAGAPQGAARRRRKDADEAPLLDLLG